MNYLDACRKCSMGALSHCSPVDRTPFWAQLSLCPCGFLGNTCQQPLVMAFVIALFSIAGTTCWREPARPLGLHFLPTQLNKWKCSLLFFGDFIWEVLQGYLQSGEAQQQGWADLAKVIMRDWAWHSSQGQKGQIVATALFRDAQPAKREAGRCSRLWHTYSLNLFPHSYTFGFSSQHSF